MSAAAIAQIALFPAEPEIPVAPKVDAPTRPQLRVVKRCAPGDLWQLGRHRLLCGDSTVPENAARLMGGARPALLIADPPYGMRLDTTYRNSKANPRKRIGASRGYATVIGDWQSFDPVPVLRMFHGTPEQFWWGADYYRDRLPGGGSWIVWDKRTGLESVKYSSAEFELCWSLRAHQRSILRVRWFGICGMESQDTRMRVHPTQKPLGVYEPIINTYASPGATVVDPFAGSGTTLIACERTGRTCYAMEIDPAYCDTIIQRWETATGQKAARTC